jgi:8-oxo-dGTP pyrophosphatase MutT (NUDIX family)
VTRPWKVLATEPVIDRPWLRVQRQHVVLPNGHEIDEFYVISSSNWAAVLALSVDAKVVMVEQYRHGAGKISLELPAGVIEADETPIDAARRELREETGFVSDEWTTLGELCPEPTRHTGAAHFFVARNARRVAEPKLDPSEEIRVLTVEPRDLLDGVRAGRVIHAVHIAAILLAEQRGLLSADVKRER